MAEEAVEGMGADEGSGGDGRQEVCGGCEEYPGGSGADEYVAFVGRCSTDGGGVLVVNCRGDGDSLGESGSLCDIREQLAGGFGGRCEGGEFFGIDLQAFQQIRVGIAKIAGCRACRWRGWLGRGHGGHRDGRR